MHARVFSGFANYRNLSMLTHGCAVLCYRPSSLNLVGGLVRILTTTKEVGWDMMSELASFSNSRRMTNVLGECPLDNAMKGTPDSIGLSSLGVIEELEAPNKFHG